jgi:hypothetical protein
MGITQLLPLVVIGAIAYFAFSRMKGMKAAASASYADLDASLRAEFGASREADETDAAFVGVGTRNILQKNHSFMIAVTNKRVLLRDPVSGPMRAFARASVKISAPRRRWTDTGNMVTTESEGWEVAIVLPDGESYAGLRLYGENQYYPPQQTNVPAFLGAIGQELS